MPPQDDNTSPATSRSSAGGGGASWEPPSPEQLQGLLQGYEFIEIIGRGGMGAVYKARQISLDRMVAIKILPPVFWDNEQDYTERFRNEARLMAKLMHPGMIAVFDFGETPDGQLYFIMEYVEGTDVSQMILKQGPLPPPHALAIAAHVCDTLRYAHAHGIIHHDIKPANVMVDMEGKVKVADFGLAKLASQEPDLEKDAMTMGTPDFVAPEALILGATVDHRADLYSLGVMLYQMLTGTVPHGVYVPPSDCVPGLDKRFNHIIGRAMQAAPEARYQNAAEFRSDLDHILNVPVVTEKPRAGPSGPRPRPPGVGRIQPVRKTSPVGAVVTVVIAMAAGGAYFYFKVSTQQNIARSSRDEPAAAAVDASQQPARSRRKNLDRNPIKSAPSLVEPEPPAVTTTIMPAPIPPVPPTAGPETETARKLRELEAQFQAAFDRDVTKTHEAAVTGLNTKYAAALERALATATNAGNRPETLALREEKQRVDSHQFSTKEDSNNLPESLRSLRATYRSTLSKLIGDKAKMAQSLYDKYDQVLGTYQKELRQAGKIDDALLVSDSLKKVAEARKDDAEIQDEDEKAPATAEITALMADNLPDPPLAQTDPFKGTSWATPMTIPPGRYKMLNNIKINIPKGIKGVAAVFPKGTSVSGSNGVDLFFGHSLVIARDAEFNGIKMRGDLGSKGIFQGCRFTDCTFGKAGPWGNKSNFHSKWQFDHCVIEKSFMDALKVKLEGVNLAGCTIKNLTLPSIEFREGDAGEVIFSEWLQARRTRFEQCKVPLSFLLITDTCSFVECTFVQDVPVLNLSKQLVVTLYQDNKCISRLKQLPPNVSINQRQLSELPGS